MGSTAEDDAQSIAEPWRSPLAPADDGSGDLLAHLRQARDHCVVCDLSHYALLTFDGQDAGAFLQAQLSSDVLALTPAQCQLSTYNSPKGRVLASVLLWRTDAGFTLQLPASLEESIRRRLSMYVLRAKVKIDAAAGRYARIGIGGPGAAAVLRASGLQVPDSEHALVRQQGVAHGNERAEVDIAMRLSGDRYELLASQPDSAAGLWHILAAHGAVAAGQEVWRWLTLRSGTAEIVPQTQDQFVPQMLNYELIGAISFTKGCYPGQEIVARTQYRGELKRRTLLAHTSSVAEPAAGQAVFSDASPDAIGSVVSAAPAPEGGYDLLACLYLDRIGARLTLGGAGGAGLELRELPYALPERT